MAFRAKTISLNQETMTGYAVELANLKPTKKRLKKAKITLRP